MPDPERERLIEEIKKKDLKIKDLTEKAIENDNEIKELNDQKVREKEEANKKFEDLKGKKDQLEKEIIKLKKEIEELKKELKKKDARMDSLENTIEESKKSQRKEMKELRITIEENEKSYQKKMQELKDGYKDDMREFEDRNMQKLKESYKKEMGELEHYRIAYQMNEDENKKLREENRELNNNSKDCKKLMQDQHKLYLGQLCFELQTNLYRYVIPERCCAKEQFYKIKDIENDIDDKYLLNDKEKREARGKLGELKKKINWIELKKLIGAIKQLQYQRCQVAHPPDVDEEGALCAAEELEKQGQLKGKTSIERVKQIIEIGATSKSLLTG